MMQRAVRGLFQSILIFFFVFHASAESWSPKFEICEAPSIESAEEREQGFKAFVRAQGAKAGSEKDKYDEFEDYAKARLDYFPGLKAYKLSNAEIVAIALYTNNSYRDLNSALRSCDHERLKRLRPLISTLNSGLAKLPDYAGQVKRGFKISPKNLNALSRRYVVGQVVPMSEFTSTSIDKSYPGEVQMLIQSKHGKYIRQFSSAMREEEVLFSSGSKFKVLEKREVPCFPKTSHPCGLEISLEEVD